MDESLPVREQAKLIKTILLNNDLTIADLGKLISKPRTTTSRAIHQGRFPKVRAQIKKVICKLNQQPPPSTR
jgi:hypothetical protein